MKCLSLHQPWATLIALGEKTIETRDWATDYRGPIAIHAAKRLHDYALHAVHNDRAVAEALNRHQIFTTEQLPLGCVVAWGYLVDVAPTEGMIVPASEYAFGNFAPGRYGWKLSDVTAIEPVPVRGHRGLWEWDVNDAI